MIETIWQQFIAGMVATTLPEYIAVVFGIASVWYSRKENILLYPVGLVSTTIYVWLSFKQHLLGEAAVNFYYTVMSVYGWWLWARKDKEHQPILHVTYSNRKWIIYQSVFFAGCYVALYISLSYLKMSFAPGAIPWADSFAAATAFTGMWLMTKKKVESWYWWIATDIASIPLYFVKQYVFTSVFYAVLLIIAVFGLTEWKRRVDLR